MRGGANDGARARAVREHVLYWWSDYADDAHAEQDARDLPPVRDRVAIMAGVAVTIGLLLSLLRVAFTEQPLAGYLLDGLWVAGFGLLLVLSRTSVAAARPGLIAPTSIAVVGVVLVGECVRLALAAPLGGWDALLGVGLALGCAGLLLPWRPMVALVVIGGWILGAWTALVVRAEPPAPGAAVFAAAVPLTALPCLAGTAVQLFLRQNRTTIRRLRDRYLEVSRELVDARRIHEGAFPAERTEGTVRFTYQYQPMRQIGGDYLHAFISPSANDQDASLSLVVLDVTGHGVPAALTVNRLHGELTRLYAEEPDLRPGEVLRRLNRYVYLTLANHTVFVTAFVLKVDPGESTLEYASAGHPPAFLRTASGKIEELYSTALVLGAIPDEEYDPGPEVRRFGPGDSLVAYTDGATEARDAGRQMLGIAGLRAVMESGWADTEGRWPAALVRAVARHRAGDPDDDTLVVEVFRTLGGGSVSPDGSWSARQSESGVRSGASGAERASSQGASPGAG